MLAVGAGEVVWTFLSVLFSFSLCLGDGPIKAEILSQRDVKPKTTNQHITVEQSTRIYWVRLTTYFAHSVVAFT